MNTSPDISRFRVDFKFPSAFALGALIFLYLLQYPLSRLLFDAPEAGHNLYSWILAYIFVIYSSTILMVFMRLGINGPTVAIPSDTQLIKLPMKRPRLIVVGLLLFVFFMWSYLMLNLKVGMTIYADFDPLPFKFVGVLFYGRLIVQPIVLSYIARTYADCRWKRLLVFCLFVALGAWAAITSGSRFTGIMFALPHLLLFKGKSRYLIFCLISSAFIMIATLTRHFYLPFYISDEYIAIYANLEYQENIMNGLSTMPIGYLVGRTMGIFEVLLTLDFGAITPSFLDAILALLTFFSGFPFQFSAATIKNVYGLSEETFGGFGLGLFPNYWVLLGGNLVTYTFGLIFSAYLLGKCYRYFSIGFARFGFSGGAEIFFVILFVFFFDARAFVFLPLLVVGWFFSRPSTRRLFSTLLPGSRRKPTVCSSPLPLSENRKLL